MMTIHLYLIPGKLTRIEGAWCPTCRLPSMWEGPIWVLDLSGVDRWGWIAGCGDCDRWVRVKQQP